MAQRVDSLAEPPSYTTVICPTAVDRGLLIQLLDPGSGSHLDPLAQGHYHTGSIDVVRMRSLDAVQPQCPTCAASQGWWLSQLSQAMRKGTGTLMAISVTAEQAAVCARFWVEPSGVLPEQKIGIARNVLDGLMPVNGLRHKPEGDTQVGTSGPGSSCPMIQISSFRCTQSTLRSSALRLSLTWRCLRGGASWSLPATRMSGLTSHCRRSELARLASASGRARRGHGVARRSCVLMAARVCAADSCVPFARLMRRTRPVTEALAWIAGLLIVTVLAAVSRYRRATSM